MFIEHGEQSQYHHRFGANMNINCADRSKPRITAIAMNYLYVILTFKGMTAVLHRMAIPPQPTKAARLIAAASMGLRATCEGLQGGVGTVVGTEATRSVLRVSCEGSDTRVDYKGKSSDASVSCEGSGGYVHASTSSVPRCATRTVDHTVVAAAELASATSRRWSQARPLRWRPIQRYVRREN